MQSDELDGWRRQIDRVDRELLSLLARRKEISKKIMRWKKEQELSFLDEKREQEILAKLLENAKHLELDPIWIEQIYQLILKDSKTL